jgi:hypothetical protein
MKKKAPAVAFQKQPAPILKQVAPVFCPVPLLSLQVARRLNYDYV